jgi:hypothetical protein
MVLLQRHLRAEVCLEVVVALEPMYETVLFGPEVEVVLA